jgi:excisionase family DNA binding protein
MFCFFWRGVLPGIALGTRGPANGAGSGRREPQARREYHVERGIAKRRQKASTVMWPSRQRPGMRRDRAEMTAKATRKTTAATAMPAITPAVLDRFQTARYLGIGLSYLAVLTTSSQIPSLKIGRRRLFRISDLDHWLTDQVQGRAG